MVDKKFIADKIKEFRKKAGLTQTELAQKIGIGEKQISKIENYTNLPSLTTFFKIIDYLKIDISEFKINTIPLVNKNRLDYVISLPMLDYFEELKNGVISTNIDPQLSHGVESLKAQLARVCKDDDDIIEIVVLKNKNDSYYKFEITNDNDVRIV